MIHIQSGSVVKNRLLMQETQVGSLGWKDPLEEEMATHSSILAWKNPMDKGAWQTTVHEVAELDTTEQLRHTDCGGLVCFPPENSVVDIIMPISQVSRLGL